MCGICGVYYQDEKTSLKDHVSLMNANLIHRGPDEEGYYFDQNIGLGIRRLKIIDLEKGRQPFANENQDIYLVYNGEIYNYKILKNELESKGHRFRSNCDAEVIVHGFEEEGTGFFNRIHGMFAFALFEKKDSLLYLVRDCVGIKPLYYFLEEGNLAFSSEIKALVRNPFYSKKTLDFSSLYDYLTFGFVLGEKTLLAGIKSVPPGSYLLYNGNDLKIEKYWDWNSLEKRVFSSEEEISDCLLNLLKKSVETHLMSDVPIGVFLSGGVDSSGIVGLMSQLTQKPIKTFTIGFDKDSYNELPYSRLISKTYNTQNHEIVLSGLPFDDIKKAVAYLDEPIADFAFALNFTIAREARKEVTVVLSGEGADEMLAGYESHIANKVARFIDWSPDFIRKGLDFFFERIPPTEKRKDFINMAKKFFEGFAMPSSLRHARWMNFFSDEARAQLLTSGAREMANFYSPFKTIYQYYLDSGAKDPLNQEVFVNMKTHLVNCILLKVDRMSMAHSLEARVPFLDKGIVEFNRSIPGTLLLKGFCSKYILKKSLRGIVPAEIIQRQKQGFVMPVRQWLHTQWKEEVNYYLGRDRIRRQGIFNSTYVQSLLDYHFSGKRNYSYKIWSLLVFQLWYENYFENRSL